MKKIAVMVSGGGSNFQAIIDGVERGEIDAKIVLCIASKDGIYAIERAKEHNIPYKVFDRKNYGGTDEMFAEIGALTESLGVELVVLAGYLTILSADFVKKYKGKIINIHPSLIPKYCGDGFYGLRVHRAVIAAGERESGATVHYVDEGVDTGNIILQRSVPVLADDTAESLAARVLTVEHQILPEVVARICKEKK